MDSATIVAASLDSSQLEQSINKLVETVASKTKEMADNFTKEVGRMEQAVKNLGNIKIDSGSASDGGSSRRTSKQKEEEGQVKATTQAYKEQNATLDQQATAMQNAIRPKSASDSYYTIIKNMRENVALLAMEIKSLPNLSLDKQFGAYMQYERQIEGVRQRIAELRQQMQEMANDPNASRLVKKQTLEEINSLQQKIVQLEREQITATQQIANAGKQVLAEKQAQYEKERQELIQLSAGERERVVFTKQQTDELDKQLQKIKEIDSVKSAKSVYEKVSTMPTDNVDQAKEKLEALYALKEKVRNTPLLSKSAQNNLEVSIGNTKKKIEQLGFAARGTNQTEASVKSLNAAVEQNIQKEQQRRREIQETGVAAQQTLRQITQSVGTQLELGTDKPIAGMRELETAIRQMRAAYFELNGEEKASPLGKALENDIKRAEMLSSVLQAHNKTLTGMSVGAQNPIDNSIGSYERLSNIVKTLTEEFRRMGREERNSAKGTDVIDKIQAVNREIRDIQRTMNRPTSLKKALGLDESTLDHINDKLQALHLYKGGLKITDPKQLEEMGQVDAEISRLQKNYDKLMAKNQQMIGSNNALGRSWNYMKNRLAFYFSVGASTQFIKNLIEVRSQYEMNERALGILINSAERGTQIFNELSQMALVSPYTLIELSNAAKQLTAYDIAAKDVVDTTRRLADMASAVGVPMERLTYALGQIKAYGYLNSRDARMFANAGIPLVRELSKYYSELEGKVVSVGDVYDRMKKKAIDYNSVMAVVTKMTDEGGKFFDFQAKMADTLKVRLANLTLAWNNMLNDIGASQQGVLTSGIGILRDLFLHWQDIYGAIQRVVLAIGLWKGAQALALLAIGELNTKMGMQVLLGEKLQTKLSSLAGSTKNLVSGYAVAGAALLFVIADAIMTYQRNAEEIEKLNKVIVDGAKESANSIYEFIESAEMSYARLSARTGKLPKPDAEKTWDALREQIELSAISAKDIIPELIKIEDLNERVTKAFNLAERIAEANNKLIDLDGKLDISQNSILFGLFGEGLVEDIDDFNERLRISAQTEELYFKSTGSVITDVVQGLTGFFNDMKEKLGSSTEEAEREIKNFAHNAANAIKDELGEEGLKDSIQVNEAVSRVLKGIEQQFPQIKGKGKALFESIYNDIMAEEFEGAVDKQAYYYKLFLERLKKDHGSAFQGVTDDILKETHRWSSGQQDAINKTAEKIKKDIPEAYQDSITAILNDLNKREFKMRIVTEFATTTLDNVQKQFKDKFVNKPWIADQKEREKAETEAQQKYGNLMRKTAESNVEYEKRVSDERKKQLELSQKNAEIIDANKNKQDALSKAIVKDAQEQKKAADDWLKAAEEVESSGGYDFSTKKESAAATKAQKAAETELQKALKEELSIIDKIRSNYQALTKDGMSHADAIKASTAGYEKSAKSINQTLTKFGLQAFDPSAFAGISDPNDLVRILEDQLNKLIRSGKAKPAEIKDLEVKINDVKLDAEKYNLTRITKGLNNELDKLKDEYELAVSLDADPELGDMFADMFGINTSTLPQTFGEALDRAQIIINRKLADLNIASPFDIMQTDVNEFANSSGLDKESEAIKELAKWQNTFRDMFKKNLLDSEKMLDDYVKKYGSYSDKIAEIEADRLEKIKKLNDAYYTEEMRQRPEYIAKMNAINQGASREKSNVEFDAFKNSRYYTMMFENLDYISTKTIRDMRDRLRELMDSMNDLTPEQLKQVMTQYEKLEQKLVKRSPFKTLTKDLKNYIKTSGDRKAANEAFRNAQKEYDAQEKNVAALKEKYEQAKANTNTSQSYLDFLQIEINGENEILKILKEQLDAAEKKADKYNLTAKLAKSEALQVAQVVAGNLKGLAELRDQMNELFGVDASKGETLLGHEIDGLIDGLSKVSDGISKATSSAQSGNVFGVVSGVVDVFTGIGDGIASLFGDGSARTKRLNREINESRETVRQLSMAYDDLERAINKSLGTGETEARRLAIANKEAQLAELERQKELEQSKRSKDRDDDAIKQYEETIHSLRNEIDDLKEEVINNLWGEEVKSAAEAFVDAWVQAWRAGETTLDAIQEKMDEMIYNLIKKAMTSKIVETLLSPIYKELDRMTKEGSEGGVALTTNELRQLAQQAGVTAGEINTALGEFYGNLEQLGIVSKTEDESNELSALQQGLQSMSESTANALEAYANSISQQAYLRNDLLVQIRDTIMSFDMDVQLGVFSQMLLQLQNNYIVMQSMQSIMEGWTTPSGQGIRVELVS